MARMVHLQTAPKSPDPQLFEDLHRGIVIQLSQRAESLPERKPPAGSPVEIERSIIAVENAASALGLLTEKCRRYEQMIESLNDKVVELTAGQDKAVQLAAKAERDLRLLSDHAAATDAQLADLDAKCNEAMLREKEAAADLDRLVKAIDASLLGSFSPSNVDDGASLATVANEAGPVRADQ